MALPTGKIAPVNVENILQMLRRIQAENAQRTAEAERAAAEERQKLADAVRQKKLAEAQKLKYWVIFLSRVADSNILLLACFLWLNRNTCSPKTKTILFGIAGAVKLLSVFGLAYARDNPLLANDEELRNEVPTRSPRRRR